MRLSICRKCKTECNRAIVIKKKVNNHGKDFVEERVLDKQFSCECGRCLYSGELPLEQISKEVRVLDKEPDLY